MEQGHTPLIRDAAVAGQRRDQVKQAVKTWSGQLIDLGGRNQLLYYHDLKVGTLDLEDADPAAVDLLMDGRTVSMSRLFGSEVLPDRLKRARAIRNKSREGLEERGIATCFVAIGMATWTNLTGSATPAAPVLLREASIAATGAAETEFEISLTGETDLNPTLKHLLTEQFSVAVNTDDLLAKIGDAPFDPTQMYAELIAVAAAVPGFTIAPRKVLGTFSYAKLPMVLDLNANLDALTAHTVISAIAGDQESQRSLANSGTRVDITDPDRVPPEDEFLVLDADSSQSYAINAAVAGQSLVLSGPPGTGKSQTIANLIATFVARGQSVLFVAEKRAAIAAVLDRLNSVGLGGLVLDMHSGAGSRSALAKQLAAGLSASSQVPRPDQHELHERLVTRRNRLTSHEQAMHLRRAPWDVSAFEVQCALIDQSQRFGGSARTTVRLRGQTLTNLDAATKRYVDRDLYEYARLGGLTLTKAESLWAESRIRSAEEAETALENVTRVRNHTAPITKDSLAEVVRATGLTPPTTLNEWGRLLVLLDRTSKVLAKLRHDVFEIPIPEMVSATASRTWRREHPQYAGARAGWLARYRTRQVAAGLRSGAGRLPIAELHQMLLLADWVLNQWRQNATDQGLPRVPAKLAEVTGGFEQLTLELASVGAYLTETDFATMQEPQLFASLDKLALDERTLRKLPRLNELAATFNRLGLDELLTELKRRRLDANMGVAVFDTSWNQSVLERIAFDDQVLANFDANLHHNNVQIFRHADNQHISQASLRVLRAAAERLVAARDQHSDQSTLVQSQAARKRGHLPLRQLFAAAPDVMKALKPCWAMSPLVVSQLLPGEKPYFDVVVFDEASQIVPPDAIPSILRAKRVVVTGDRHQLPPTSFFAAAETEDETPQAINADGSINLELTKGFESILDSLSAALGDSRTKSLTWHYRSADERLIAFSNAWIYDNSLTTFPGISGRDCLSHVLVDQHPSVAGQEDSVTAEVERVVTLIVEQATRRPDESLGVITMGVKHRDRIDAALREFLRANPQLVNLFDESKKKEPFFVKNLENVQGDERDAIILSIGYGKTSDGRLPYRFGPLLQEGGQRRLNVAITRARRRMTLVSSFSVHDMDPTRSAAEGVKMLRAYLQYAESGGANLGDVVMDKPALNPFEISVRDALLAAGVPLIAQYGVAGYWIDFAAAHPTKPGQMVLAIEADGATYHSSHTARDRDRLRQEQLERLGWTFHRIWSTDWFNDSRRCVQQVRAAYDGAVAAADARAAAPPAQRTPVPPLPSATTSVPSPSSGVQRRLGRPPIVPGTPITEYSAAKLAALIRWIESDTLLRTEAQLYEAFINELGYKRRGTRIQAAFDQALRLARASPRAGR